MNRLTELFAGATNAPNDNWTATLSLPEAHGASAPISLPVVVSNVTAAGYQIHGEAEFVSSKPPADTGTRRRGGGRRGGMPGGGQGGGMPGGGRERDDGPGDAPSGGPGEPSVRLPYAVDLSVSGEVRRGMMGAVSLMETRTVVLEAQPFTNVSGWKIEAVR